MADRCAIGINAVAIAGALGAIIAGLVVPIVGVAIGAADPVAIMGGVTGGDGVAAVVGGGGGKVAELKDVGVGGAGPCMGRGTEATGCTGPDAEELDGAAGASPAVMYRSHCSTGISSPCPQR